MYQYIKIPFNLLDDLPPNSAIVRIAYRADDKMYLGKIIKIDSNS